MVWNLVFISLGGQFSCRYIIPMATRHIVQSSLKVQDGVSFFFKMESAQLVPFFPQDKADICGHHSQVMCTQGVISFNFVVVRVSKITV